MGALITARVRGKVSIDIEVFGLKLNGIDPVTRILPKGDLNG